VKNIGNFDNVATKLEKVAGVTKVRLQKPNE